MEKELKQINLSELNAGYNFTGIVFLVSSQKKTAKNGNVYLDCTLKDNSIAVPFPAKLWDIDNAYETPPAGSICWVRFLTESYNNSLQGRLSMIKVMSLDELPHYANDVLSRIIPTANVDVDELIGWFEEIINKTKEPYRTVVKTALDRVGRDKFYKMAAGLKMHGAYRYGNLVHTTNVMKNAIGIAANYDGIDMDLLICCCAIHDIGKAFDEFVLSDLGLVEDYTVSANLNGGHIISGASLVESICKELDIAPETTMLIKHMILSHHGQYGPVQPGIPEAYILSLSDGADATLEQFFNAALTVEPGKCTEPLTRLGGARIYHKVEQKDGAE